MNNFIHLSNFGKSVPCDKLRAVFNLHNRQIFELGRKVDIVFIGDSITEFWNVNAYFCDLGFVVNRGVGGDTSNYILQRLAADVFQFKPEKMVYLVGINDILNPTPNTWEKKPWQKDKNDIIFDLLKNIEESIKGCVEHGIKGYFCSILPTDFTPPYDGFGVEEMILKTNDGIKSLCEKYGVIYVDYYSALVRKNEDKIISGYTSDCVHPTAICYNEMSKVLREYLLK